MPLEAPVMKTSGAWAPVMEPDPGALTAGAM
jgi:hypothetical protein